MRKTAIQIVKILQDAGHQAVFAGGCVRDQLNGVFESREAALEKAVQIMASLS